MRKSIMATLAVAAVLLGPGSLRAQNAILTGPSAFGDWTKDAPGTWRKIVSADLPKPYTTLSASRVSVLVPRPPGSLPHVLPGFSIEPLVTGLTRPRTLRAAPNGDIFFAEIGTPISGGIGLRPVLGTGRIRVIRAGAARGTRPEIYAANLDRPFGLAFYPPGPNPRYLYVGTTTQILRFPYHSGDVKASGPPETVVGGITDGVHFTRDVLFSRDGKTLFVSIGSSTNIQEKGPDNEAGKANILAYRPDGSGRRVFAAGLRNPVSIAFAPHSNDLWTSVNERDLMGDDLPPDYVTRVTAGAFYGWPYYYIGPNPDTRPVGGTPPVPADRVTIPDVLIQPHSAPLGIAFYTGHQFPAAYQDDLFVALHGSWNRALRTGYKVVRMKMSNGRATGAYEDFVTGFVAPDGSVWGRPVGLLVAADGALLMSDDASGTIWRIAYHRPN